MRAGSDYRLSERATRALESVVGPGVGEVRIIEGSWYPRLHGAVATTRPGCIYLAMSGREFERDPDLMLHEFFHVLHQWRGGRMSRWRYLAELLRRGYRRNRYEVEARAFAARHTPRLAAALGGRGDAERDA